MLAHRALELLRTHSPHGLPLERHCERINAFALALAKHRSQAVDAEALLAAAYLHDIGLLVREATRSNYLQRGLRFVHRQCSNWDLSETQRKTLDDALLYSHSLSSIPGICPTAELLRQAVAIEHSRGLLRLGLSRQLVRDIQRRFPWRGFDRVLLSFFKTSIIDDGPVHTLRLFFPRTPLQHQS